MRGGRTEFRGSADAFPRLDRRGRPPAQVPDRRCRIRDPFVRGNETIRPCRCPRDKTRVDADRSSAVQLRTCRHSPENAKCRHKRYSSFHSIPLMSLFLRLPTPSGRYKIRDHTSDFNSVLPAPITPVRLTCRSGIPYNRNDQTGKETGISHVNRLRGSVKREVKARRDCPHIEFAPTNKATRKEE